MLSFDSILTTLRALLDSRTIESSNKCAIDVSIVSIGTRPERHGSARERSPQKRQRRTGRYASRFRGGVGVFLHVRKRVIVKGYWDRFTGQRVARRRILIGGASVSLGAFIAACGGGSTDVPSGDSGKSQSSTQPSTDTPQTGEIGRAHV